jgi:outer membrane protein assembly factor BamB
VKTPLVGCLELRSTLEKQFLVGVTALLFIISTCFAGAAQTVPLGSPQFMPSPEQPIGWRGDGTGRYPAAAPPILWERKKTDSGYTTKNIRWMAPLPNIGVSMPIIVGDRIFLTTEISDLVCLEKQTGRVLWIRSNLEFEGLSETAWQDNPIYAEKLMPLIAQLSKANADGVEALNAQMTTAATAGPAKPIEALVKKRALEKQIHDQQLAMDKKKFERYWGQAVFGFGGPTPTSDGKRVCAFFTTGVTVCYDLEGNRQWIHRGRGGGSEHGNFASPLLCENRLVVWANEMRAYDVASGKLLWTNPETGQNTYGSLFRFQAGNEWVAAFQSGYFARLSDGKPIWGDRFFGDSVTTPIVENGFIYAIVGYPRNNDESKGFRAFNIPSNTTESNKWLPTFTFKTDWAEDEVPVDKQKTPFNRGYVASPLFVDGLIYRLTQGAGLSVNDAATGELVYRKVLPMKPRTQYWDWSGACTSPTLAGNYIFFMDNQGTTVIIKPGKQYEEVAINRVEESKDGKSQVQNNSTPIFEGSRMYYRTPGFLYCIGEK